MERTARLQKDSEDLLMKEVRGVSLGQASLRQAVNLPDISGNKVNMQQSFKKKELQISTSVNKNVVLQKANEGQIQLQTPSIGGRSYYDTNAKKLPQITQSVQSYKVKFKLQPRHRESSSNDYISLGARIQDQMKQYNTSSQSQNIQMNKHIKTQSVQPSISRGGPRAISRDQNIMTPTHYQLELLANTHSGKTPQSTTFENYLKKVIKSVERRKKKGHLNASQKLGPLVEIESSSKYGFPNANNTTTFQNFSNQVLSNSLSLQSQNVLMHKQNQQLTHKNTSQVVIEEEQSKDDTTNIDNDEKISFTKSLTGKGQAQISCKDPPILDDYLVLNNETTVQQDPKATEQVAFLLREAHKKNQIFIPLEQQNEANSQFMYKEMKNAPNNHAGVVVFSKQGFVTVGKERNATSDFISNDQFIQNGVTNLILKDIPFFKKFQITRLFKQWKYTMRWNVYNRKREQLARSWVFSKPIFSEKYDQVTQQLNSIRTLPLIEIKQNVIYGKKQQQTLEERCIKTLDKAKTELNEIILFLKDLLQKLKKEIVDDDYQYDQAVKENKVLAMIKSQKYGDELVMFSKARRLKELEEEQLRVQRIRHQMFDKLIEYIVSICKQNLLEALFENKREFKATFTNAKNGPQFEILICFNEHGGLDTDPPLSEHHNSFLVTFENVEKSIYQNQNLMEFINELNHLFFKEKILSYKSIFKDIKTILWSNSEYKLNNAVIFDTLNKDLVRCREYLEQFMSLQTIYDFTKEWNSNKKDKISLEMGFYKETWLQMDQFNLMIEEVPSSNTKLGTIMVETITLKKYLQELPKSVIDSIRHNVTLTMETETKSLREELSKTSEILDQLPTSLNVYVEQVNTLKYVKEKQEDFKQKFQTITKLHQLCKQDNIKVNLNLQMAIEEVQHLYEQALLPHTYRNLPKLQKTAAEGLSQNKDTMERIMQSSSLVLSKKIKAFEKKYVETYLQDRSRLEDCADTLEELFKRSSKNLFQLYLVEAIHEIRSKVILYKEFLKLLYEDEPNAKEKLEQNKLQCGDDYEFVADLHKQTIKLWKMLLYWKKRRQMCYNSPFLQLDTSKVIRSINKVSKYFEEKLSENEFIRDKARPLSKVVIHQVKETSLIIEFLKDLRKESLQQRHWLQIFNLIKAPHLKNSVTFTIINLREYHIQNYREEIQQIIEHANTELKYEKIFKSIKEEWEQLELKIIPYRETMDSYILINTDILTSAIEENLTTLETIGQSQFAQHVKDDILDWIKILKTMLRNVEIWVEAQKYWINLDSIFPGVQLQELFQQKYQEFMDLRSHFKRIMWSAYKNPKATYNLNIGSRIDIFNKLIGYFAQLQKKVNDYLEQKRLAFPRFFFLTDAQFLKFLTLANSNQDFNAYINQLFQGAQKLYINKIYKAKINANEVSQREQLIQSQLRDGFKLMESSKQEQILPLRNKNQSTLSVDQHEMDQGEGKFSIPYLNHATSKQHLKKKHYTNSSDEESSQSPGGSIYEGDSLSQTKHREGSTISNEGEQKKKDGTQSQYEIMGMIGLNKELFLFEKQVLMESDNAAEKWLVQVEAQMQETIARMINYAVSSFPKQSLDEWILDYPQQIIMTTIHLILSHEVNELLDDCKGPKQSPQEQEEPNSDEETPYKSKTSTISAGTPSRASKFSTKKYNSKHGEDEEDQAMIEYMKKKNELKAAHQAKEEEEKKKKQERLKAKAKLNEIPADPEKEKRKFIDAMFGKDFPVYASILQMQAVASKSEQPSKGEGEAKGEYKDTVMTMLQNKSFKGLYLRLQFWVNQIIKVLYGKAYWSQTSPDALEVNLHLHSIQKMSMKSIIVFLQFHRDIVDSLMQHNVTDSKDFEWQSQIRLQWTGVEPGCKVECGGWSTYQQNEYLGSSPRLVLTPLTNRYFVFISSALREKSAVIFKCAPSHQFANDVFEEFSNICTVPYKRYQCNAYAQMKLLMQYINGAALASVWIFFEHLDKLPFIIFQTFNKEVQMVQQQFIIAELSGTENKQKSISGDKKDQDKRSSVGGVGMVQRDMHIKENKTNYIDHLESQSKRQIVSQLQSMRESQTTFKDVNKADQSQQMKTPSRQSNVNNEPFTKIGKACFGVFGSISHAFILNHSVLSDQFLRHSQSAFRALALTRPNEGQVLKMVLKAEGFDNYEMLSELMDLFLKSFYEIKEKLQSQDKKKWEQAQREQVNDQINMSDLKATIKLATILKEQELSAYFSKVKYNEKKNQPRDIQVLQKTRDEKIEEIQSMELKQKGYDEEREKIEMNSIKEGLKLVFKQKFFNQWRDIQLSSNSKQQEVIDQYQVSSSLEQSILQALEIAYTQYQEQVALKLKQLEISQQLDEIDKEEVAEVPVKNQGALPGLVRKVTISANDIQKRFQASSGLASLEHSIERQMEEKRFLDLVTVKMREAIQEMKIDKVNAQLRNCINVIEYLRRVKGIALVGPVCTGKTQILKIVSRVLQLAFGITMRTSVVNSTIFSHKELYGATEAFQKQNAQQQDQGFGQQSVFEIILDVFEKERGRLDSKEAELLMQSIFFDSVSIDSSMAESLLSFMRRANYRESENNCEQEFLISLSDKGKLREGQVDWIPVTFPNCNILMFPSDLCLFFEAESLRNSSPSFVQQVGLIMTEADDLEWTHIYNRHIQLLHSRHHSFFTSALLSSLPIKQHLAECFKEFMEPFLEKLQKHPKIASWSFWNIKSSIIQFFALLNSAFYRLAEVVREKEDEGELAGGESMEFPIKECIRDVVWSSYLMCVVWAFGAGLSKDLRKVFEEQYAHFRRKFNIALGGVVNAAGSGLSLTGGGGITSRNKFTLFDIYFDPEKLQWDLLQEKLEYKLKLHYDPLHNTLLIPTVEISQAYFMADYLFSSIKHEEGEGGSGQGSLNKHLRLVGPSATSKSIILNTFAKRSSDQFQTLNIPMSAYLTFDKMKGAIESFYTPRRRNLYEPKDKDKKIVLIIDDLHLQSNLSINVLEFLRTWCISKGYYDVKSGLFKNIADFGTLMAENSDYRRPQYASVPGREPLQSQNNRFLFYSNMLYQDEFDQERFKVFIQHWLTSKMWNTSKIVNKYYILITNCLMTLSEKLKRSDVYHYSSFLRLQSFHLFARFCANLANYTLISDDTEEGTGTGKKGREEDAAADMMAYELQRTIADRILMPQHRVTFMAKIVDACKTEFLCGNHMTTAYLDGLLLGNYHNRRAGAHIKYLNYNKEQKELRDQIREKLKKVSNNHFLESFLDAPNGLKEVFRLSRILFKEMQHVLICGMPGTGKHEYLQLAALLNDALMFEINAPKYGEPLQFARAFKDSVLSAIALNAFSFIVINDQQLRDPTYIDYVYNFIVNICNKEHCVLMDQDFKQALIDSEGGAYVKGNANRQLPSADILLVQAIRKIQKNVHIVFLVGEFQTYFDWVSLFPGLESKCEVIYIEELTNEGYAQLSQNFFQARDIDNGLLVEAKLSKCLVDTARQAIRNRVLTVFYTGQMLAHSVNEDFLNCQMGEYIMARVEQVHGHMYANGGGFQLRDSLNRQTNYSLPVEMTMTQKARYIMFIELFRFLFDFLSLNLVIRRNYYDTFLKKNREFTDFFKDIKSTKTTLHSESNAINCKLVQLKDKIGKTQQLVTDKEGTILRRRKDIQDLEVEHRNNKEELNQIIREKDALMDEILEHLEKTNGSEFSSVITLKSKGQWAKESERDLMNVVSVIIEKDPRKDHSNTDLDMYFLNREELISILDACRHFEYDAACFQKLKTFITQYTGNDFKEKSLYRHLFAYLMELYRKLNVRNTMANTYAKIQEIKDQIQSHTFSINYSSQFIDDKKEEMEGQKAKYEKTRGHEHNLSKRIEEAEISHMRTDHIFTNIEKHAAQITAKLTAIQQRLDALLGDCIIMAASVCYLGVFAIQDRVGLRKELAENIRNTWRLKCSSIWFETKHSKAFRQVLKEYGLRKVLLPHNHSRVLSEAILLETLFTMVFAPSCPLVVDPTGQMQEYVAQTMAIKSIFASDANINTKIEQTLRSSQFAILNDLNDCSKDNYGLSSQDPILQRLASSLNNGFDFDYEKLTQLKDLHSLGSFFNSFSGVNKRIPTNMPEFENLSFYQVQVMTPRLEFTLSKDYMSKLTMVVAMDSDQGICLDAWVEVKECLVKHFLPEVHTKWQHVRNKIRQLNERKAELHKVFENAFLVANQDTLQNISEYSLLKQSVEDIKYAQDEKASYMKSLNAMLADHALLTTYANIMLVMFLSCKTLSKITGEITYSWRMFLNILDQILQKTVRDLNVGASKQQEFTIDEEFFSTVILPGLHSSIISGIKQHLVPLYNLIFSLKMSLKKRQITEAEADYFLKQLLTLKDFQKWRETDHEFVDLDSKIEKTRYFLLKRELIRIYPDVGRKTMDQIEKELGQNFVFKTASLLLFGKLLNGLTLMQKINIGLLCPDHEFKSKLCQLVYEQLSTLFAFNEEYIKLHHFIKTASWSYPIALFSQSYINIINTVCSIASYYGVGLEVLRTEMPVTGGGTGYVERQINGELNQNIKDALTNYNQTEGIASDYERLFKEAVTYGGSDIGENTNRNMQQINYEQSRLKDNLHLGDKMASSQQIEQNPLKVLETCAINGSWVFISTLKFPQFWHKMCLLLNNLRTQGKISNSFRVFMDLQGFTQNEIPDSFLFDNAVSFHLTEQNNEDMEGFNDIWANILNDKILTDLTTFKVKQEESEDKIPDREISHLSQINIDNSIKNDKQRALYKEFMRNQKEEDSKNISNTLIFGSEGTPRGGDNAAGTRNGQFKKLSTIELVQKQQSISSHQTNQRQVEEEEAKISRINSINQSADISKGENAFIKELQGQFEGEGDYQNKLLSGGDGIKDQKSVAQTHQESSTINVFEISKHYEKTQNKDAEE